MASQIERMIDAACGLIPGTKKEANVLLLCPDCGQSKTVSRHHTDPPGTKMIKVRCGACDTGDFEGIVYFDADGKELFFE